MAKKDDDINAHVEKVKLIREASKSLSDYNKLLNETKELQSNINFITGKRTALNEELEKQVAILLTMKAKDSKVSKEEIKAKKRLITHKKTEIELLDEDIIKAKKRLNIHEDAVKEVKLLAVTFKDVGKQVGNLGKKLVKQSGYLLDQQKAVKETELSMGVLSNQANGFRNNIYKSSITTTAIGVGTADLAKIQGRYSDNIGRGVQLSEEQLIAMGELAKGTVLGVEGAAEFAAEMDSFNISAKGSADLVEDMLHTSHKMGVSSGKVIKNVQKNIKLLHKYNFKGGVKGLTKMAALATKFKFEMSSIANFAENLITPEGAVEAAAKLQVLGGAWAQLGDPFELMYRSRNDMAGLTEDIINATKQTAKFNDVTGEVSIDPMELHRLREVANATGLEFESLAQSAKMAAKFAKIEGGMSSIFDKDDKTFLSGLANWDEDDKEFKVKMRVGDEMVEESVNALKKITPEIVKSQMEYQQTLKKNAEQSMTFAERWEGLENMFRSVLLPGFEAFANALENSIGDFHKWAIESGITDKLVDFGKWVGELAGTIVKFIANNPITSALTLGAGYLVGKAAMWIANGRLLRTGFNLGGPMGDMFGSGKDAGKVKPPFGPQEKPLTPMSRMDKMKGKGFMGGKYAMGTTRAVGAGIGLGVAGMGLDYGRSKMDDPKSGAGKALGVGSMALQGAGLGMMFGPIGAGVGALLGGLYGAYKEFGEAEEGLKRTTTQQDFISRPGESAIPFSSNDTLVGAKKDGPIDKLLNKEARLGDNSNFDYSKELLNNTKKIGSIEDNSNQYSDVKPGKNSNSAYSKELLNASQKKEKSNNVVEVNKSSNVSGGKVLVDFKQPLKVEGKLELTSNGNNTEIDLDDPILMRNLSRVIQEQLTISINGGKASSNPVSFA